MTKENPNPCEHDSEWIEDNRKGLHCCLCGWNNADASYQKRRLYVNNLHYIVCIVCLPMLKTILQSKASQLLDELEVQRQNILDDTSIFDNEEEWHRFRTLTNHIFNSQREKLK